METSDDMEFWRHLINSLPDTGAEAELAPVLTGVEDQSYTLYDTTSYESTPYPMAINALVTDCEGKLRRQLQVAFNAFSGLKESLDHCKSCRKCNQRLLFLQVNARHDIDIGVDSIWARIYQDSSSAPDKPTSARPSNLSEIIEALEGKTIREQAQILAEAKRDLGLIKKLQWLKNILDTNL